MEIGLPDGSTAKISSLPDFATEATQKQMLAIARQLAKNNDKAKAAMENLVANAKDSINHDKKANEEQKKAIEDLGKEIQGGLKGFRTKFADRIEADTQQVFGFAAQALGSVGAAAIGAAGFLVGLTKAAAGFAENVGRQMDAVVQAGAGFNDQFGGSLSGAISALNGIGLTTEQATGLMADFSRMTQIVTKARLPQMTRSFLAATNNGRDLGLTLADATRAMADEIQLRSELMDVSSMDSRTLGLAAAKQIAMQNRYAAALGMSVEQLRKSSAEQVKNNNFVLLAQLKYGPQFTEAMRNFATTVKGQAGESFDPVADALMTMISDPAAAATEQGQAISRFASAMQAAGVPMMDVIQRAREELQQTGRIDGEAFGNRIIGLMRQAATSGSDASKILMSQMIGETDPLIAAFAQSIINLQTSANRMQKNLTPDAGKSAIDQMRDTVNSLTATFDNLKLQLFSKLAPLLTGIMEGLMAVAPDIVVAITTIVDALVGGTGRGGSIKDAVASLGPSIRAAGDTIAGIIRDVKALFKQYTDPKSGDIDWGGLIGNLVAKAAIGAITLIKDAFVEGIKYLWENPQVVGALVAGIGVLMGIAAAKAAAGAVLGGVGDRLRDRISGRASRGVPGVLGGSGPGGRAQPASVKSIGLDALKGVGSAVSMLAKGAAGVAVMFLLAKALPAVAEGIKSFEGVTGDQLLAAGAALVGMSVALFAASKIFSNPMTIAGLAVFTLGIMGLGKALQWAAPFVKEFAPIVQTLINAIRDTALGLMDTFVKTLERIPEIIRAIGDGAKSVFEGASGLVTSIGTQIQGIITSIANGISTVISSIRGAEDKANLIKAQTDSVKELAAINPGNINNAANAINALSSALEKFGAASGGTLGQLILNAAGGGRVNAIQAQIDMFNQFGTLNTQSIYAGSAAITKLTESLNKFADIDVNKMAAVNESIYAMTRANDATIRSMEKIAQLDGKTIAENARAIMIYNGAAQGEIIVPPTPAAGADLSSFYQAIVRALNGGTPVSQSSLNPSREGNTQPETLQQQMVRLLGTINSGIDRQNSTLRELSEKLRT